MSTEQFLACSHLSAQSFLTVSQCFLMLNLIEKDS